MKSQKNILKNKNLFKFNSLKISVYCKYFIDCKSENDILFINPSQNYNIKNNSIKTDFDHRIAMAFAIAGLIAKQEITIHNAQGIETSFPGFLAKCKVMDLTIRPVEEVII